MEMVWKDMYHQDFSLTQHPISEQEEVESNNELSKWIKDNRQNIKLYSGNISSVAYFVESVGLSSFLHINSKYL